MKISHKLCVRMGGTQFFYYDGLQPKMRAGMIKLHECNGKKNCNFQFLILLPYTAKIILEKPGIQTL